MKSMRLGVAAVVLSMVVAASAQAELITKTDSFTLPTDFSGQELVIDQFDESLGTLNSVTLVITGTFKTRLTITNQGTDPSSGSACTEFDLHYTRPGLVGDDEDLTDVSNPSPKFTWTNLAGGATIYSTANPGECSTREVSDSHIYTGAGMEPFKGLGSIVLTVHSFTEAFIGYSGGNTIASQQSEIGVLGTIIYDYTPVPEPATMAFLGLGGLVFAARRVRRRVS